MHPRLSLPILLSGISLLFTGCATVSQQAGSGAPYHAVAYQPTNPAQVRVKVSLSKQMVYVMEGEKPLLVTATTIGKPGHPTPSGTFAVTKKIAQKRSGSYGFWVKGDAIISGKATKAPGTGYRYVGFPMPYWVEFKPEFGFHEGYVWPVPRSHGCLRLHKNVAPKFFALVSVGTPVEIRDTMPEDATLGRNHRRPDDYLDPDPPRSHLISAATFNTPSGPLLETASPTGPSTQ